MKKSALSLLALASFGMVALAGCHSQSSDTAASSQQGTTPQAAAAAQAAEAQRVSAFQKRVSAAQGSQPK